MLFLRNQFLEARILTQRIPERIDPKTDEGLGGGFAYKKYKTYLHEKQLRKERKERRQRDASASEQEQKVRAVRNGAPSKSRKPPRKRKTATTKSKPAE